MCDYVTKKRKHNQGSMPQNKPLYSQWDVMVQYAIYMSVCRSNVLKITCVKAVSHSLVAYFLPINWSWMSPLEGYSVHLFH